MHERDILLAALEKVRPEERAAYLAQACGADAELRSRVDALLRASQVEDSFLESPAVETELLSPETDGIRREIAEHELSLDFLQPSDKPDALGRLGHYEITEVIGRGGMGVVLKARDTKLGRVVAIKVLVPELASNPTARKRFQREAHAAAAVVHQHIVTIHAVEEDRLPYLVMECIAGQSLKEKIDREGHLQLVEILRIGQQVASGLAAAHAHGLIHRDVKPANILLENGVERVRITDFGLARAVDDVGMTRTGEVAGTPQFMSPEQAQGLPMDSRSDLFSFGSVLYAMCTGRPPFRAESAPAVLHRICHDTPRPIHEINPEIPNWLLGIIDRLLKKDPAERFQSAREVAELLGQYLAHAQQPTIVPLPGKEPVSPERKPGVRLKRWSVALAALSLVLILALGLTEASGVTSFVPTVIRIVRGEGTLVIEVADPTVEVSLDGEELSIRGAGLQELRLLPGKYRLHATKDGQPVKDEIVTITRGGREVAKVMLESSGRTGSSSSRSVAESTTSELTLLAKLPGHTNVVKAVGFLPDGERMVSVDQNTVVRTWDLETRSVLSTLDLKGGYCSVAEVSADGRFVAISASAGSTRMIRVWDLQNQKQICEAVHPDAEWLNCIRFTPDGTHVLTDGKPHVGVLWNIATGKEVQRFEVNDLHCTGAAQFSPDGRLLAMEGGGRVRLFDVEGGELQGDLQTSSPGGVISLAFTPSGDLLACGHMGGRTDVFEVNSRQLKASLTNEKSSSHVVSMRFIDNERLLITRFGGAFEVWDLPQTKIVATAASELGTTKRLALSPNGRYALAAHGEGWDEQSNSRKATGDYALRLWQLPESVWPAASRATSLPADITNQTPKAEAGAFVLLGGKGVAERKFNTLAEAVQSTNDGDTIEIRGNGPFVTEPITLKKALTMRAGESFQPTLQLDTRSAGPLLTNEGSLVLEGIEFLHLPGNDAPVKWSPTLSASGADLQVANCRFVRKANALGPCVRCDRTTRVEFRNSQFTQLGGTSGSGISYQCPPLGTLLVENCVSSALFPLTLDVDATKVQRATIRLRNNTWAARNGIHLILSGISGPTPDSHPGDEPLVTIDSAQNVFDIRDLFIQVDDSEINVPPPPKETLTDACRRFLACRDEGSLYPSRIRLGVEATQGKHIVVDGQVAWDRFWNLKPTQTQSGTPKFQGGDLDALHLTGAQALGPEAFRLRPDSPGYRAGPDGKDFGADVDLVGPGAAYERWKKTPEYQEWLVETKQSVASSP